LLLLLIPAADIAIALAQRVVAWAFPPRRLSRLDFTDRIQRIPDDARTMVVVPTILTSAESVAALLEHMEVLALGNLDPCIHFAILSDFADAESRDMPEDAAILSAARAGVDDLNRRFGPEHTDRFFLCHRDRRWNPREQAWMGWERKRGKLEEFNRLIRGATDTSFTVHVGESSVLPAVRYCITLDSDTRLPRNAAKQLIGIIAHPLNRPHFDAQVGRVTRGYGIVQPRVSVTMASAAGSLQRRHFYGEGPVRCRRVRRVARGSCAGERAAVARSLRGPLCANGPRHGHRGRRRLSVERPRARETPAPMGTRRLADPVVALSFRAVPCGSAAQSPAARVALEDPR